MTAKILINLVVFDGDDTLWRGLDGGYISGINYFDQGRDNYTFHKIGSDQIRRNDGQRFSLFPEARKVLTEITRRNTLVSLASYNHTLPVISALRAFEIEQYFSYPVIKYSPRKNEMLRMILRELASVGWLVRPSTTLFIDDDHRNLYRGQMKKIGVHFLQKAVDILDLSELINHPRFELIPAQKGLI